MLQPNQTLTGPLFNEPMRVLMVSEAGEERWSVGLVGTRTSQFTQVTLTREQLESLSIQSEAPTFDGDGDLLRLGLQAIQIGLAYEFDPYFGLSMSRVDPLPHQLEAVYEYLLKLPRVRFLLADDAGAGKTIMAGLLLRELKLRGLVERTLIVCPANLTFQWQRELREKFDETFWPCSGSQIREEWGINVWMDRPQIVTSLDLAKRDEILPGLRQVHWDLVIVDEAHRMSASSPDRKSLRYKLGELLRDSTAHLLLLTATPHKGDPTNFSLFLQLLDRDVFADVVSINQAMQRQKAPFYLRRTKEQMVHFPTQQEDGTWAAQKIFTRRIVQTADFALDGDEFQLYRDVTRFVKRQSRKAAENEEDPRARAVGFLMSLYQRRLASSAEALRNSLANRATRLTDALSSAQAFLKDVPSRAMPSEQDLEEMDDAEREYFERLAEAVTLSNSREEVEEEIAELQRFAARAEAVKESGAEAKLAKLNALLDREGFRRDRSQRLLLFTEFRDTLKYLVGKLQEWGFSVGQIHGQMKPGARDEEGTRLWAEEQFREGNTQILVATEAAGEGINLQCCHILFNYDIPWNPNRLEQRMGRIHRYGQTEDCLIFNFVAVNTIEGSVLNRLLVKLDEIRAALDNDAVFNVVGEVLPAAEIERVLRDYYAGRLGDQDLEDRLLRNVNEEKFRSICEGALEALASKQLNLAMLVERRALAKERRLVPETVSRFLAASAGRVGMKLEPLKSSRFIFDPGTTPQALRRLEREDDWNLPALINRYPRICTDRELADKRNLEWVCPGHPLFEALRRWTAQEAETTFAQGATFHSVQADQPTRLDVYAARVLDGLDTLIHERLFVVEVSESGGLRLRALDVFENLLPGDPPAPLPSIAAVPEPREFLEERAFAPLLQDVEAERVTELERVREHIELSLKELIDREDDLIGRLVGQREEGVEGASGNLAQAEERQATLIARRTRRREELEKQTSLTVRDVKRLTSVLVLPHPDRDTPHLGRLRPNPETEATAMEVAMQHERDAGRQVWDVHEDNEGYDVRSLDPKTGALRLIEVKGIAAADGDICLTPNERRVAEDRPDCYWLYVVTSCATADPQLTTIPNPGAFDWRPVQKLAHYTLSVAEMQPKG